MLRKSVVSSLAVLWVLAMSVIVYAHCHDSAQCEEVQADLVKYYWDKQYNNTVKYYVNPDHIFQPSLTTDVNAAAVTWTNIEYQGIRIPFNLSFMGTTEQFEPDVDDGLNVVGWLGMSNEPNTLAYCQRSTYQSSHELIEVDIIFNYYIEFNTHAACDTDEYCIKATASHEFGHFAGLLHVESIDGCNAEYSRYTMWKDQPTGPAVEYESLECEDKWALHYTYTVLNPN